MRTLRIVFLGLLGAVLLTVALANRESVTLRLLPEEMGAFLGFGWVVDLPLFLVAFAGIAAGLLIGFVWEWFREHKHRAAAATARRQAAKFEREVNKLKVDNPDPQDEILSLLEKPRRAG